MVWVRPFLRWEERGTRLRRELRIGKGPERFARLQVTAKDYSLSALSVT